MRSVSFVLRSMSKVKKKRALAKYFLQSCTVRRSSYRRDESGLFIGHIYYDMGID